MSEEEKTLKAGPLAGIKVLEISQWIAGPAAGAMLGDFGADVIKVEHPVRGDAWRAFINTALHPKRDVNFPFEQDNRNKRAITLDLSKKEGQEVAHKMIGQCDILLTNLRPDELKRYDLEYEKLSKMYPKLIWANVTGYGLTGPDAELPGFDYSSFWARAGFQALIKEPSRKPIFPRPAMGDHITSLSLFGAIMLGLYDRERTGKGSEVTTSLYGTGLWAMAYEVMAAMSIGSFIPIMKLEDRPATATNYLTKDGKWIMLFMVTPDPYWSPLCKSLELGDVEHDERFSTFQPRRDNNAALHAILAEAVAKKDRKEWEEIFKKNGVIYAPVMDPMDIIEDPQALATDRFLPAEHPVYGPFRWVNNPISIGETPASVRRSAPEFGQHTEEVLEEMGFSWDDIISLKDKGVIA